MRPRPRLNWSLISDAELDRLEGLAIRAARAHDQAAFLAALAPDDRVWLTAMAERLGIERAAGAGA